MTALATAVGLSVGALAVPTSAFANVPVGGWCYEDWYNVQSVSDVVHNPLITPMSTHNDSDGTITWGGEYDTTATYTSTYSTTTTFSAGIDWGVINVSVNRSTTVTTTESITTTTKSTFSASVPPHTNAYATYGTYGVQSSGVYNQTRYPCDENSTYPTTTTAGNLTAYNLTDVGWHYWDSNGSTEEL